MVCNLEAFGKTFHPFSAGPFRSFRLFQFDSAKEDWELWYKRGSEPFFGLLFRPEAPLLKKAEFYFVESLFWTTFAL